MFCFFSIAPDAPVNVTIGTVTAKTVSISWVAPTSYNPDQIIRYDIEVIEKELGLSPVKVNTVKTTILVTGLEEHNKYSCKVAAVSNSQVGEFSSLINFTTLEAGLCVIYVSVGNVCGGNYLLACERWHS